MKTQICFFRHERLKMHLNVHFLELFVLFMVLHCFYVVLAAGGKVKIQGTGRISDDIDPNFEHFSVKHSSIRSVAQGAEAASQADSSVTVHPVQHDEGDDREAVTQATLVPPHPVIPSCQAFIDVFSDAAANYSRCAIQFARPLRFCENCVEEYMVAHQLYNTIMEGGGPVDIHGRLCRELVLNSDRVQIIKQTGNFIDDLWSKCSCETCFNATTHELSHETQQFREKYNETWECFHLYEGSNHSSHNVCRKCGHQYDELNHFFDDLDHHHNGDVCMDIQDMVNSTRSQWSRVYGCRQTPGDLLPVLILSGFFSLLPIVFYLGNRIHGARLHKKLMRQRRLRDVSAEVRESETGSTNDDPMVNPGLRSQSAPAVT